jgi:ketosteroid isomerase-like protein
MIATRSSRVVQAGWTKEAEMLRKLWLGGALTAGAVAVLGLTVALSACGGSSSVNSELQEQVDKFLIGEIEKDFHQALSTKDIDQMMSLWAENATFTAGPGKTAAGTSQIRQFWLNSRAFKPSTSWVSDHPAYKLRVTVSGDRGTLHFECHFVDVETGAVEEVTAGDLDVARIDGNWLITNMVGGSAELSP